MHYYKCHTERFRSPENPLSSACSSFSLPPTQGNHRSFTVSIVSPFPGCHRACSLFRLASFICIRGASMSFCGLIIHFFLSLIMFLCLDVPQFIRSAIKEPLGGFQVWAILKTCYEHPCTGFSVDGGPHLAWGNKYLSQ